MLLATNPVAAPKVNNGAQTTPQASAQGQARQHSLRRLTLSSQSQLQSTNSQDKDDDSDKD